MRTAPLVLVLIAAGAGDAAGQEGRLTGFTTSPFFAEQVRLSQPDEEVRLALNAPSAAAFQPRDPTRLIVYATPNGNTIEQTAAALLRHVEAAR